ncbi:hypothetical protein ABZS86_05690 [Streptomyces sp. NPDC005355]|uniref:effector-associated constant component EACC1 n=1 Tax=Streptomyces sp. NPDC005355 TaxID=3157038 RepID=UPI0033A13CB5
MDTDSARNWCPRAQLSAPGADLESLAEWLRGEPESAGRVRPRSAPPAPGEMGAVTEPLVVSLGAGGAVSVLASALRAWLSQPRRSAIRIKVHGPEGRRLDIDAKQVSKGAVADILRQARREERTSGS